MKPTLNRGDLHHQWNVVRIIVVQVSSVFCTLVFNPFLWRVIKWVFPYLISRTENKASHFLCFSTEFLGRIFYDFLNHDYFGFGCLLRGFRSAFHHLHKVFICDSCTFKSLYNSLHLCLLVLSSNIFLSKSLSLFIDFDTHLCLFFVVARQPLFLSWNSHILILNLFCV